MGGLCICGGKATPCVEDGNTGVSDVRMQQHCIEFLIDAKRDALKRDPPESGSLSQSRVCLKRFLVFGPKYGN